MFRSPYPDVEIPDIPVTDYVLGHAGRLGHKPALVNGATGRTLTYAELAEAVAAVAGGLARRGLAKGDVVAICLPNVPEYAVAFHGVASAGGVVAPMSPISAEEELAVQLRGTGARFLVTIPPLVPTTRRAAGGDVEELFVLGEAEGAWPGRSNTHHSSGGAGGPAATTYLRDGGPPRAIAAARRRPRRDST